MQSNKIKIKYFKVSFNKSSDGSAIKMNVEQSHLPKHTVDNKPEKLSLSVCLLFFSRLTKHNVDNKPEKLSFVCLFTVFRYTSVNVHLRVSISFFESKKKPPTDRNGNLAK